MGVRCTFDLMKEKKVGILHSNVIEEIVVLEVDVLVVLTDVRPFRSSAVARRDEAVRTRM